MYLVSKHKVFLILPLKKKNHLINFHVGCLILYETPDFFIVETGELGVFTYNGGSGLSGFFSWKLLSSFSQLFKSDLGCKNSISLYFHLIRRGKPE